MKVDERKAKTIKLAFNEHLPAREIARALEVEGLNVLGPLGCG